MSDLTKIISIRRMGECIEVGSVEDLRVGDEVYEREKGGMTYLGVFGDARVLTKDNRERIEFYETFELTKQKDTDSVDMGSDCRRMAVFDVRREPTLYKVFKSLVDSRKI